MDTKLRRHVKLLFCIATVLLALLIMPVASWASPEGSAPADEVSTSTNGVAAGDEESSTEESASDESADAGEPSSSSENDGEGVIDGDDNSDGLDSSDDEENLDDGNLAGEDLSSDADDQESDSNADAEVEASATDTQSPAYAGSSSPALTSTGTIELVPDEKCELNRSLGSGDTLDAYLTVSENCYVTFAIEAASGSASAKLLKADTMAQIDTWTISSGTNYKGLLPLHPGRYKLTITSSSGNTVITSIDHQQTVPTESLAYLEEEPNNSRESANPLPFGKTIAGTLCSGDSSSLYDYQGRDSDCYSFTLGERKNLKVTMSTNTTSEYFGFYLIDSAGKTVKHSKTGEYAIWGTDKLSGTTVDFRNEKTIDCGDLEPGTYYIEVVGLCSSKLAAMAKTRYQFSAKLTALSSPTTPTTPSDPIPVVDANCALLRADGSVWACSSEGYPISMMNYRSRDMVRTLLVEANVKMVPRDVVYAYSSSSDTGSTYISIAFKDLETVKFCTNSQGKNSCTSIGAEAFDGCGNLSSIIDMDKTSLITIGKEAFKDCTALTEVSLPTSLKTIGEEAFFNCTLLENLKGMGSTSLITIDSYAFCRCSSLSAVTLPKTLKTLKTSVFEDCVLLRRIDGLGNGTLSIVESYVFGNCISLTSLTFPKTLTSLGSDVFTGCTALKKIVLPSTSVVQFYAGSGEYTFDGSLFESASKNGAWIYVPGKLLKAYRDLDSWNEENWSGHLKSIEPSIAKAKVTVKNQKYTGSKLKPSVTVKLGSTTLKKGTDYKVSYSNNVKVGKAKVTVTGIGKYYGKCTATFTIKKAKTTITASDIQVAKGKSVKIGAKASKGAGKLTYKSSNTAVATVSSKGVITGKKPGKASITITAAGNANRKKATKKITVTVKRKK